MIIWLKDILETMATLLTLWILLEVFWAIGVTVSWIKFIVNIAKSNYSKNVVKIQTYKFIVLFVKDFWLFLFFRPGRNFYSGDKGNWDGIGRWEIYKKKNY